MSCAENCHKLIAPQPIYLVSVLGTQQLIFLEKEKLQDEDPKVEERGNKYVLLNVFFLAFLYLYIGLSW